jgi:hypothetical protein
MDARIKQHVCISYGVCQEILAEILNMCHIASPSQQRPRPCIPENHKSLCAMDGKIKQRVCIKFCVKLGKSTAKTLEMLHEAFGEHSLSRRAVFERHSHFKAGQVSVEDDEHSGRPSSSKMTENAKKFENLSTKTVAGQSMSLRTPLGSAMELTRRS